MFDKNKTVLNFEELDIEPYINSTDIFNSKLLYIIPRLPDVGEYEIDLNEYRIDLISKDIYGTDLMSDILLLYNGLTISQLAKGIKVKAPYLSDVKNTLRNISLIDNPVEYLKTLSSK